MEKAGLDKAEFTFIRDRVKTTDGNLSTHLRKLEDNGYINVDKRFEGRKPVTEIALSPKGREAFEHYLARLESMLGAGTRSNDGPD